MIWYKKEYVCPYINNMYITTYNPNTIFFGSDPGEKHRQFRTAFGTAVFLFNTKTIDSPIVSGSTRYFIDVSLLVNLQ